jgi:hypothetical protein
MLAKLDVMTVRAEIAEADVDKIQLGQTAWFTTLGSNRQQHSSPKNQRHASRRSRCSSCRNSRVNPWNSPFYRRKNCHN